ncbi:MAG: YhcH/YjgK/YiaL family protein [Planctomycetes bacterium]|nr:YhcH/YjgK/YiaL family protein [Planctomycetota bacterium]
MILAPLADADRYAGLHPRFARAFAWCGEQRNLAAADGRRELGDGLAVIIESGSTHDPRERRFESHRANIDIQVNLSGGECMDWIPTAELRVEDDFAPDGDIAFYAQPERPATRLVVDPGWFAIFYPQDAHKPVLHRVATATPFRKLVFKVPI